MALSSIAVNYNGTRQRPTADSLRALHALLVVYYQDFVKVFEDWKMRGEPDEHFWNEIATVIDWYNSQGPSIPIPNLEKIDLKKEEQRRKVGSYFYDQDEIRIKDE